MKDHPPHLDFPQIQHQLHATGDGLVRHLQPSDWLEHTRRPTGGSLPELEIGEHGRLMRALTGANTTLGEKLEAARQLIHDGVRSIHFTDEMGRAHDYRIQLFKSGRVRVTEGNELVVGDGRRPSGLSETGRGHYRYVEPQGGREIEPGPAVDRHRWNGVKNADGSVTIGFTGCQVDTDGRGAYRHPEDRTRQSHTSLKLSDGRSLDTDKDNFFVLPPSVARAYGIHKGDLGWLVQKGTGNAVPVVFGDSGPEGKLGEASVAALKALGYDVNGRRGVSGDKFEIVFAPGSGDGTGDIASDPHAMVAKLNRTGLVATNGQIR